MNHKLIEQIKNNNRAISLIRVSDTHFEVVNKKSIDWDTMVFNTLVDALRYFNELAEMFEVSE